MASPQDPRDEGQEASGRASRVWDALDRMESLLDTCETLDDLGLTREQARDVARRLERLARRLEAGGENEGRFTEGVRQGRKGVRAPYSREDGYEPRRRRSFGTGLIVACVACELLVLGGGVALVMGIGGYYFQKRSEAARIARARIDCETLSTAVETYKLNNGDYPASIEALASPQPLGQPSLVRPDQTRDPWGKPYQIDPAGAHNGGNKADVFTVTPEGRVIGNWSGG